MIEEKDKREKIGGANEKHLQLLGKKAGRGHIRGKLRPRGPAKKKRKEGNGIVLQRREDFQKVRKVLSWPNIAEKVISNPEEEMGLMQKRLCTVVVAVLRRARLKTAWKGPREKVLRILTKQGEHVREKHFGKRNLYCKYVPVGVQV